MKVLLISVWKPRKGGIITHVENLLKHSRNVFVILTYQDRDARNEPGIIRVPVINVPVLRGISFALFSFLKALRKEFDIIHAHYAIPQGLAGALIKKVRKKPLVITVHGSDLTVLGESRLYRPVLKWVLDEADLIIAVSSYMKGLLINLGIDAEKIRIIYSGVDSHATAEGDTRRVVFVGALVRQKAVDSLIEAFKDIKEGFPDVGLVIVGDGPERKGLEALVSRLGVRDVEFKGYADNLDSVFTSRSVFVLPSSKEGFG
ncbi:MAG: glycosyltransferase, partial [Candidatus Hydrothermarchaeales archaeon]